MTRFRRAIEEIKEAAMRTETASRAKDAQEQERFGFFESLNRVYSAIIRNHGSLSDPSEEDIEKLADDLIEAASFSRRHDLDFWFRDIAIDPKIASEWVIGSEILLHARYQQNRTFVIEMLNEATSEIGLKRAHGGIVGVLEYVFREAEGSRTPPLPELNQVELVKLLEVTPGSLRSAIRRGKWTVHERRRGQRLVAGLPGEHSERTPQRRMWKHVDPDVHRRALDQFRRKFPF